MGDDDKVDDMLSKALASEMVNSRPEKSMLDVQSITPTAPVRIGKNNVSKRVQ